MYDENTLVIRSVCQGCGKENYEERSGKCSCGGTIVAFRWIACDTCWGTGESNPNENCPNCSNGDGGEWEEYE
ncbi:MAG: hypothetical protein ISS36_03295 [Candidatus Aenigmarchaeota archaeon]|nr:hypothetical protein [Candidatus Aenigmarchaeota archaeon]